MGWSTYVFRHRGPIQEDHPPGKVAGWSTDDRENSYAFVRTDLCLDKPLPSPENRPLSRAKAHPNLKGFSAEHGRSGRGRKVLIITSVIGELGCMPEWRSILRARVHADF